MNTKNPETNETNTPKTHPIHTCHHVWKDGNFWSLTIGLPYRHVHFQALGYQNELAIFEMQREDMINLAHSILEAAMAIPPQGVQS